MDIKTPEIEADKEYEDYIQKTLETLKKIYDVSEKKLSKKGISPKLPKKIKVKELPGKIGFRKYMKLTEKGIYIFTVPDIEKVFGYYDPVNDEAVVDPIFFKDTEFSKLLKKYGLKIKKPSLEEVLAEESIIHPMQNYMGLLSKSNKYKYGIGAIEGLAGAMKDYLGINATAYPYETCMIKKLINEIANEYGLKTSDILTNNSYDGRISYYDMLFKEFDKKAAPCYEQGKCACS